MTKKERGPQLGPSLSITFLTESLLVPLRLLPHRAGEALDRRAAHLVRDELRAGGDAVVLCDIQVLRNHLAGLDVDLDVGHDTDLARGERAEGVAAAGPDRPRL